MIISNTTKYALYRLAAVTAAVALILWGCLWVLTPFVPALIWAMILCLTTWPAFVWLQNRMNGYRTAAALVMTLLLALGFVAPMVFLGSSLADNFGTLYKLFLQNLHHYPQSPPQWLIDIPWLGQEIADLWQRYLSDSKKLSETLTTYAEPLSKSFLAVGASIGRGLLDLSLGILIAFFFFRDGVALARRFRQLLDRFIGPRGQHLLGVFKNTMIAVVYGILGAALAQGTVAGIGFWIAGIPGAPLLGLLTFILSILPFGPPLIWIPATIYLYMQDQIGMAIFMGLWGMLGISAIDNVIRPYFISLSSSLPLLLVLLGVFGGIIAFGFIGLFLGPTLLALAYTLITEWGDPHHQYHHHHAQHDPQHNPLKKPQL
ncbi:MAG: AI-2E family transporter [Alphaproteobacteria bacterium]|nr:AI-2E family transporter [Alphaproteobacteria bacterium]